MEGTVASNRHQSAIGLYVLQFIDLAEGIEIRFTYYGLKRDSSIVEPLLKLRPFVGDLCIEK